ncbi:MAG: alpha-glucan family phosphorylase [Lentisphaerae bacterium]|nr:alpha-glucan family phosphorylase [Lentisphaerota bacterium]
MKRIQLFNIAPSIPEKIRFLEVLARNYWWSWNPPAAELFQRMDAQLWESVGLNPVRFLSAIPQKRFEVLAKDKAFVAHVEQVRDLFQKAVVETTERNGSEPSTRWAAYFSLEYGIHESLRIYSGGLGVLAGDHLKAASDLDLPLVAVGLFYRQGFFQQHLNQDGWQQEHYVENQIDQLPLVRARDPQGQDVRVRIPLPEGMVEAIVWRLDVGRVPLLLLDTNIPQNPPEFQHITDQLYGGDRKHRLRQEMVLGIGGYRVLLAMGIEPKLCHLNEGHAAFAGLARLSHLMQVTRQPLEVVLEIAARSSVFTTHTPVPAGNETFPVDMLRAHLEALRGELGLDPETIIPWGFPPQSDNWHEFSMTIFAMRMASNANAVSELHGRVARRMWQMLWPGHPQDEVPIGHVTNGIHMATWISHENENLFARYLGPNWKEHPDSEEVLSHVEQIPDAELWRTHELCRTHLITQARTALERQCRDRNSPRQVIEQCRAALDPQILTIGFARRFATYKRGSMILRDAARLEAILCSTKRPMQIIFAGKAHPRDDQGKHLIQQIIEFSRRPSVAGRLVFLENYDMGIARALVQGVDVWLNNPRRPHEASGTSGMKAAMNGGLHVSTLDGWWCEGYTKACGWAIGDGEEYEDTEYQDSVESQALYNLLENELVPTFYNRTAAGVPTDWVRMMKASIQMALGKFSSRRMVDQYHEHYYRKAREAYDSLMAQSGSRAIALVAQRQRLQALWSKVHVEQPVANRDIAHIHVGEHFTVRTRVHLDGLKPEEVSVQVFYGPVSTTNEITASHVQPMRLIGEESGSFVYEQELQCESTGRFGFTTRALPAGEDWHSAMPGYMTWADGTP